MTMIEPTEDDAPTVLVRRVRTGIVQMVAPVGAVPCLLVLVEGVESETNRQVSMRFAVQQGNVKDFLEVMNGTAWKNFPPEIFV